MKDEHDRDRGGVLAQLLSVLETIADAETDGPQRRAGHVDTGRTQIEYEYSVSVGLGPGDDEPRQTDTRGANTPRGGRDIDDSPAIETRALEDGGSLVVADLSGVTETTPTVAVDDETGAVTLCDGDDELASVSFEDTDLKVSDVRLNNRVMVVRLETTAGDTDE